MADALKEAVDTWIGCLATAIDEPRIDRDLYEHAQTHELLLHGMVAQVVVGTAARLYIARVEDVAQRN